MSQNRRISEVLRRNKRAFSRGTKIDASGYVVNLDVKLPAWVKCHVCGGPPLPTDWLKPVNPEPNCRKLIHVSHIANAPQQSAEAGFIARNA